MNEKNGSELDFLSPVWTHLTDIRAVRGEGIYIYDNEENQYTDFTSGIGVVNTGHCHPRVVEAVQTQASKLLFGQMNCVIPPTAIKLAAKLNEVTPEHINRFFFANSGAEATEASVKLAKAATGRSNIIVFQGSFHGRTHLTMAMTTSKTVYRHKFQPLPSGIFVAPFPYAYYYGWDEETTVEFCKKQLDLLLHGQTAPDETAAIIIEPVLGEGGYIPAPSAFLHHLRDVCDQHGILLIIDEVQSGFGRTGKLLCFEHAGVKPDIIVMAKGLGSGLPISAIASSNEIMEKWKPGTHGGTYGGGSAIAGAAACATIDVMKDEELVENSAIRGEQLVLDLRKLQKRFPIIGDVRGLGLMIAVEFTNRDSTPNADLTSKVVKSCIEKRLLLLSCGSYKNVIRWIPPLTVTQKQITEALMIFESALGESTKIS
ncbi:MAG: aminotransferase class III-fold pyridoxal phosphate-dependent enzyme [Saprospiraceae bacterium]|nr:aminotransferase class III-fold pyridoxal phosphate-dependent enzyme [Saprospiraceae bacterium]|tara:strand:+ start:4415 stop:5701 length:1287 start_codon:yes stop_codon:yes gene_type:complete